MRVTVGVSMAVAVGMPMLWLLRLQSRDPLAAVNKAQLGVSSVGEQSLQKGLHSQPIDHQHICLGQQTRVFGPSLKAVGPHLGRDERPHLRPIPRHGAGKLRHRQDGGHHLRGADPCCAWDSSWRICKPPRIPTERAATSETSDRTGRAERRELALSAMSLSTSQDDRDSRAGSA